MEARAEEDGRSPEELRVEARAEEEGRSPEELRVEARAEEEARAGKMREWEDGAVEGWRRDAERGESPMIEPSQEGHRSSVGEAAASPV